MTPLQVKLIMDAYALADGVKATRPLMDPFVISLQVDGLLTPDGYCTEMGKEYVRMIIETPLPVQVWLDPRNIEGKSHD